MPRKIEITIEKKDRRSKKTESWVEMIKKTTSNVPGTALSNFLFFLVTLDSYSKCLSSFFSQAKLSSLKALMSLSKLSKNSPLCSDLKLPCSFSLVLALSARKQQPKAPLPLTACCSSSPEYSPWSSNKKPPAKYPPKKHHLSLQPTDTPLLTCSWPATPQQKRTPLHSLGISPWKYFQRPGKRPSSWPPLL